MRVALARSRRADHVAAQVVLAAALVDEGLTPVPSEDAEVACVFEPTSGRAAGGSGAGVRPRVALVDALEPSALWRDAAERFAAVDDRAAEALVVGAGLARERVVVTGWPLKPAWHTAGTMEVAGARRDFGLGDGLVVLVDTRDLDAALVGQVIVQLGLVPGVDALFDAPDDATAALLRARCRAAGIRARRFGDVPEGPVLWRAADVVIGRARAALVAQAAAVGAAVLAVGEPGSAVDPLAGAGVGARRIGRDVPSVATLAAALDLLREPARLDAARAASSAAARPGAARAIARLVADVARRRDAILAESAPASALALSGVLEEVGISPADEARLAATRRAALLEQTAAERELEARLAALKARLKDRPD